MSFLFGARPQPSSAEKIAMAEAELELITDMYNKYASPDRAHQPRSVIMQQLMRKNY